MIVNQFLFESQMQLQEQLSWIDQEKSCLIQIFTNALQPAEAVALAQMAQSLCPEAQVVGTSVSGIIYSGEQYENCTLVVVEQFDHVTVATHLISLENKSYEAIGREVHIRIGQGTPALLRLFVGAYYDYAHQLIEQLQWLRPQLKIVGGMAGELCSFPKESPFIFDSQQALDQGLVFCTLESSQLMVYGRINTAHEAIGQVYTITDARERSILAIEDEPAQEWLQRNFGVLSTKEYETWEEIAQNDPLVRLQLALESNKQAIRFIHYHESRGEISQYFSRLPTGSRFRISYTSPSKCAEESLETCREVAATPIEQLFCYSCLFRKLYLKNCAKWELSPYHQNAVSGVFLLGEFGYNEDGNTLLNGSCVLSGVAEQEKYLSVDMSCLDAMEDIRDEDEKLMEFIRRKQMETDSHAHRKILEEMVTHESNQLISPFRRMNVGVPVGDLSKYEVDKEHLRFNKLCMVRAENADVLIGQKGQLGYFAQLKSVLEQLQGAKKGHSIMANLHFYSIKADTFLVASNQSVERYNFSKYVHHLQQRCDEIQKNQTEIPFLLRFVLVRNHPFLLERAYAIMESSRSSQLHVIMDQRFEDGELTPTANCGVDELTYIHLIQYALEHDQVVPYYQGLYNNQTGKIDKYEALMRLRDENGKVYTPYYFMEISKKYRFYLDLNLKMFQAVLRDFSQLDCGVCINLSVHDILSLRFRQEMGKALHAFPKPSNLTFELLEDECVANMDGVQEFITEARSYGVKIAVDDFGSGYSNLLEIAKIRPDYIKIDGQIISNLGKHEDSESILEAISLLGERLSIQLVAEFVETEAIQAHIMAHSIFYSQGYHFSKPKPFQKVLDEIHTGVAVCQPVDAPKAAVDQDEAAKAEQRTAEERDFFRAIQALTSDLLFRYDLTTGQMRHYGEMQEKLGIPSVIEHFPEEAIRADMMATEDIPAVLRSVEQMRRGVEESGHFRIYNKEKVANWYRMEYKVVLNQRNVPIEVIGKLTNIQEQKDLEARINVDPMTGCLRKDVFETLVTDYMQKGPSGKGTLFIIDLDHFKSVNDNLGHQFGDRVLKGVGDKLRALFRGNDFVGRIGGDEFMVMMAGSDDLTVGKRKAKEILGALDATYTGVVHAYHVSASIGMAFYPQHGTNFQTLYDHADMALFDAKNHGKNGYVVFHNTLTKGTMENTLPFEVAARTLAQHYDAQVVEETFNLLFETKEFEISIQTVLELIGKRFAASRCYIFEQHPVIPDSYQNTYEWCGDGITSEKWRLDAVPLELFQEFFDQANGDGILYCNDLCLLKKQEGRQIMEAQGIKSFLHTYIIKEQRIAYVIGMDECDSPRVWTPIEISTMSQAGKIIAQFLSYKKALQDIQKIESQR